MLFHHIAGLSRCFKRRRIIETIWNGFNTLFGMRGRLTPSFRTVYSEVLDDLRKEMRNCFVDLSHKEAFDLLYKEAWRPEEAAMGNSTLPTVLDKLCMVANINARKLIELKKAAPVFLFLPYLTDTCATYSLIISPQALCNN